MKFELYLFSRHSTSFGDHLSQIIRRIKSVRRVAKAVCENRWVGSCGMSKTILFLSITVWSNSAP